MRFHNFGKNVRFAPATVIAPRSQEEVAECLRVFRGRRIRAIGSLHSWSEAAVEEDVVLDLRHLNTVTIGVNPDGGLYAEIEAGCTVDRALEYLSTHGGYTLPTYGIIGKQTMAGCIATATHGSGRASLSGHVSAVTVAAYDEAGRARIYRWTEGRELLAARCGVGCSGIVLSVRVPVEPDFLIEEKTEGFPDIEPLLELQSKYPRQQFYLIPWSWKWLAQSRRPRRGADARPTWTAPLMRRVRSVGVDVLFNGVVRLLAGYLQWWPAVRWLYRHGFPVIAGRPMRVVDGSIHLLKMRHDRYRHVEMELFVRDVDINRAARFVEWALRRCGGETLPLPPKTLADAFVPDATAAIEPLVGTYVHDYLITFRRVLHDETLISMTSGTPPSHWYAISLITYRRNLKPFFEVMSCIADVMGRAFGARPHWGKICPLTTEALAELYPSLADFRAHCSTIDPDQAFVNDFARRALGFHLPAAARGVPAS